MTFTIDDEVMSDVRKAASVVASRYPSKFEREDVAQAIYADVLANLRSYERAADRGKAVLFSAYKRTGYRYCQIEKTRYLHYSDQYMYSAEEIKDLLVEYFHAIGDVADLEAAKVGVGDVVIGFFDLDVAFSYLRDSHKRVLAKKYHEDLPLTRSEQNQHSKAIRLLSTYVNEGVTKRDYLAMQHDGPRTGNRPSKRLPEDAMGTPERDAIHELQRIMEKMH